MKSSPTSIPDVILLSPEVFRDNRGYFTEVWRSETLRAAGLQADFVQENQSLSESCTLRGLHYQIQHAQGKLVRVISGEIFDVAVDLRRSSESFGKWVGVTLSEENGLMAYLPPGFAHGFFVTSPRAVVIYTCTDYYRPEHERTLLWSDPDLNISWPIADGVAPLLSPKDRAGKRLAEAEVYP